MRKIVVLLLVLLLSSCSKADLKKEKVKNVEEVIKKEDKIDKIMSGMSIDEKISQMLIIQYDSSYVDDNLKNVLKSTPPGGFILMKDNITTFDETRKFVSDLNENSKIPLIISIDEEGGSVQRLKYLTDVIPTDIPFMYDIGLTGNYDISYNVGKVLAEEVKTVGVNVDFAPVIDVYSNINNQVIGKRSFSSDVRVVSDMGYYLAKGLEDNGVIATYKHFPGHGDTDVDSHVSLPVINKNIDELNSLEFIPFKNAIKNGAKMIMIGHIALPLVTGNNEPATLSKKIIDILKNDLNYKGIIITDALNMGALTNIYSSSDIYIKAIEAGNDLLLIPVDGIEAINFIKGNVSEERINESVKKILRFKFKYLNNAFLDKSYLGNESHKLVISNIG